MTSQYLLQCLSVKPMLEEYWRTFLELVYFWGDFLRLETLYKLLSPKLKAKDILQSTWFPISILLVGGFLLLKRERNLAAILYLGTFALYFVYYLVPMVRTEFGGIYVFGAALVGFSAIAIYYLFIRSE